MTIIIPSIVSLRWSEACANPSIARWKSLAQMCSSMVVNGSLYAPGSAVVDDLRTLAHVAHINALEMQPVRIPDLETT
jgi:hypothetical protein